MQKAANDLFEVNNIYWKANFIFISRVDLICIAICLCPSVYGLVDESVNLEWFRLNVLPVLFHIITEE